MAIERHRLRGTSGIHWRITPERILVRLGLAEATDRTAEEVDAQRRIHRIAAAVLRVDENSDGPERKQRAAAGRLRKRIAEGVEHSGLATDERRQEQLLAEIDALRSADALVARRRAADWASPAEEETPQQSARSVRWRLASRTEPRTDAPPVVVRLSRRFEFVQQPAEPPMIVHRRVFAFQPGAARTAPVRRLIVVRTRSVSPAQEPVERDVFVREVTAEILAAADRGDRWGPDYDRLMERSRRSRSWCEKVVSDARKAVFRTERRTEGAAA